MRVRDGTECMVVVAVCVTVCVRARARVHMCVSDWVQGVVCCLFWREGAHSLAGQKGGRG